MQCRVGYTVTKHEPDTVFGVASADYTAVMKSSGVAIELKEDWGMPFAFEKPGFPSVQFRNGEIGVIDEEIHVTDGTEALVADKVYRYGEQKWHAVAPADADAAGSSQDE